MNIDPVFMNTNTPSARRRRRRFVDDCTIVYFDTAINEANLGQLRQLGCSVEFFTDSNQCADFIARFYDKKVFCLISSQLPDHNISFLNNSPPVHCIHVICTNEEVHESRAQAYRKVKGVYRDMSLVIEALRQDIQLIDRNFTPITILSPISSSPQSHTLNATFMYCQLLKETFLEMNYDQRAKRPLVDMCKQEYANYEISLRAIDEFDRDYEKHPPTWWYTRDCFVHRMLNEALRTHDIEVINNFGFFIKDLHYQLEELHLDLPPGKFTVYRGQGMTIEEFRTLKGNVGGLLSFNSFLSTSIDEGVSNGFALSSRDDPNMKAILFIINIDVAVTSNTVAYLGQGLSYFPDEQEYLWAMNTIFQIGEIREAHNGLCYVHLAVTNEDDPQLRQLTEHMRSESGGLSGIQRLGKLMIEMGEWNKAKEIYETLLQQETSPSITQQLGFIAHRMNSFDKALQHYQNALSIILTDSSPDGSIVATLHSNIGCVLIDQSRLGEARKRFQRTLKIERSVEKPNQENIVSSRREKTLISYSVFQFFKARCQNNIATILEKQGRRREALKIMTSTLPVLRECLPPTHPDIAALHSNIATIYDTIEDYPNALKSYQSCLDIQMASLPSNHPDIVRTNRYMSRTLAHISQREEAARNVRKMLTSACSLLPSKYLGTEGSLVQLAAHASYSAIYRFLKNLDS